MPKIIKARSMLHATAVESNVVSTTSILQASLTARQWFAGLMCGTWQGGNTWLTLEVGTGTSSQASPYTLGNPIMRKLIDSIYFVGSDGVTQADGPTTTMLLNASLQTPDANGQTITEYGIYAGGLNLNQAPFGVGMLILYQSISPIVKNSSMIVQFSDVINV